MASSDEVVLPIPEAALPAPEIPRQVNPEDTDAGIEHGAETPEVTDPPPPKQKTLDELRAEVNAGLDRVDDLQTRIREKSAELNVLLAPFQKQIQNVKQMTDLSSKARVAAREKARKEFSAVASDISALTARARYECELREEMGQAIQRRQVGASISTERILTWQATIENGARVTRELIDDIRATLAADEKRWID